MSALRLKPSFTALRRMQDCTIKQTVLPHWVSVWCRSTRNALPLTDQFRSSLWETALPSTQMTPKWSFLHLEFTLKKLMTKCKELLASFQDNRFRQLQEIPILTPTIWLWIEKCKALTEYQQEEKHRDLNQNCREKGQMVKKKDLSYKGTESPQSFRKIMGTLLLTWVRWSNK